MKRMIRIIFFAAVVMTAMACATSKTTDAERRQKLALTAQNVRKALDDRYYTIDMTYIRPVRTATRHLDGGTTCTYPATPYIRVCLMSAELSTFRMAVEWDWTSTE